MCARSILWVLLVGITTLSGVRADIENDNGWVQSKNLADWYSPLDLCLVRSTNNGTVEELMSSCEASVASSGLQTRDSFPPMRCRAGNSWPSRSSFCSAEDKPMAERLNFQRTLKGFDDPSAKPLASFFSKLASEGERTALLLVGDSVMQQFMGGLACELEREGVWTDRNKFTNTDETQYVVVKKSFKVTAAGDATGPTSTSSNNPVMVRFLPVYHFVNGRHDRIPHANFHRLKSTVADLMHGGPNGEGAVQSLVVVMNMGLHYVDNPVPHFTPADYEQHLTTALRFMNDFSIRFNNIGSETNSSVDDSKNNDNNQRTKRRVRVFFRETSAQHFPTPNGYWPGQRYAHQMRLACVPVKNRDDWRNRIIHNILNKHSLNHIRIIPFYNQTVPLWSEHPNGQLKDCTHFCWTPMLYQSIFHTLDAGMKAP